MQILWQSKKAFVREILACFDDPKPPVTTISSIVRKLEREGWISHETFGKTHRYYPLIGKEVYRKSHFQRLINNYFGGSAEQVLSYFVKEDKIDSEVLEDLLQKIKNKHNAND